MTAARPQVPFFPPDLFAADRGLMLDLLQRIGRAPEQRFVLGEHTRRLEELLRERYGAADVVACGSGTSALTLVLGALGIGAGDEVVVPALGCAPLAACVTGVGAVPVFADVDPHTLTVDPCQVERRITVRTAAVMPAHLFSAMADMPRFVDLARRRGVRLVEDSAVAQGAVLDGRPAGLWGEAGVYSFVQVKSFGMPGEGGAVVTRDADLGRRVRMLRNHGQDGHRRFVHHLVGHNSRFDEIQAAFQCRRLAGLSARLRRRTAIAEHYTEQLAPLAAYGVRTPPPGREGGCPYVYTVLAERRNRLARHLRRHGVDSHVYYPLPLPHQPAFAPYTAPGDRWPHAERAARHMLSLPLYPHLTDGQVNRVVAAVKDFVRH
ncbi:DegT/DnrJ/EryC1/StrS family aminotransferase [Streptomyces minutiscleroticus]|uniref:DegT/DnrJ/EryC1/StrS family aminotransferase n=1 Tax=Streptomyces minutiscleroticus TaxID=68238 RepID=UPI003316F35A